jgi:hypothetical protein
VASATTRGGLFVAHTALSNFAMSNDIPKKENEKAEVISSATHAIQHILDMGDDVKEIHKIKLLAQMLWIMTEADGLTTEQRTNYKYKITYISEAVKKRHDSGDKSIKGLRHEHVYTKAGLIHELLASPKDIDLILKKAIACIVTDEEHLLLPHKGYVGWERYKKAKIRVWDTKANSWKIDYRDFDEAYLPKG